MKLNALKLLITSIIVLMVLFIVSCNKDKTAPVITILGNNPLMHCIVQANDTVFLPYHDPGATAIDDEDGDVTDKIETTINVNASQEGTYSVVYIVEDNAGNKATASRTVDVMYCK